MEQFLMHLTVSEFQNDIRKIVEEVIRNATKESKETVHSEYYTRQEVKERLHVSYPTLNRFDKEGILKAHKIGGRVLYIPIEVEEAIKKNNSLKYSRSDKRNFYR